MRFNGSIGVACSLILLAGTRTASGAPQMFITIGTGSVSGSYYPAGEAICRLVNDRKKIHGIRCNAEATAGSEFNVNMLASGELDVGLVQADLAYKALHGEAPFSKDLSTLRSVFSLHTEAVTLVAEKSSGITRLKDLKGKRVDLGGPGSGDQHTATDLLKACGILKTDLGQVSTLPIAEVPDAIRGRKLDAFFYVVGHPASNLRELSTSAAIDLVPLEEPCVDGWVSAHGYFVKTLIPGGIYGGVPAQTPTFGMKAILLTSTQVPDRVVYEVTRAVLDHLDVFRSLHPSLASLKAPDLKQGLIVPLHPVAEKYFKEKGL